MIQGKSSGTGQVNGPNCVEIPKGWNRILENGSILYISPCNSHLHSLDHVIEYLKTDGTCKCGLDCPLYVHHVFNFDTRVPSIYQREDLPQDKKASSCKLCRGLTQNVEQLSAQVLSKQKQKSKQAAQKASKQPVVGALIQGAEGPKKGSSRSRSKPDPNKPKRVCVSRPRKISSSSLTQIPSPPLQSPVCSPVQNVPNNLGALNQGPLPSFASIVSSSKFFNPGHNRGPLIPTSVLPPTSLQAGQIRQEVPKAAVSMLNSVQRVFDFSQGTSTSTSNVSTASNTVVTTQSPLTSNVTRGISSQVVMTKGQTSTARPQGAKTLVSGTSSCTSTSTIPTSSISMSLATTQRVPTVMSAMIPVAPKLPSTFVPLTGANPVRAKPKGATRAPSRARPRARAGSKSGAKSKPKVEPKIKVGVSFPNAALPMAVTTTVSSTTGSQVMSTAASWAPTYSWPVSVASAATAACKSPTATAVTTTVYHSPITTTVLVTPLTSVYSVGGVSNVMQSTATTAQAQPVSMATSGWTPLSHLNYQAPVRPPTQAPVVVSSVVGGPRFPTPQAQPLVASSIISINGMTNSGTPSQVAASSATSAATPLSVAASQRLQAPPGMMYVTAKPGVFPTHYPYVTTPAQQLQKSEVLGVPYSQPPNTSTGTALNPQQSVVGSQVVTTNIPVTQTQGKLGLQIPAMYAASPVVPLSVQNFDMSQYKGSAYQLHGAMYPSAMTGNAMTFLAPPTKGTFTGVPSATPVSQLGYQNPYMLGIVMPTANTQQPITIVATNTSPTASTSLTASLPIIQPQNVANPAVAAAYESFVPIAPASGGSVPRFAQTLQHLASAYNSFTPHGMVPAANLQFTYRMMQMSAFAGNPHAAALLTSGIGTPEISLKYPINSIKQMPYATSATASATSKVQTPTQAQSMAQAQTTMVTNTQPTLMSQAAGMRSPTLSTVTTSTPPTSIISFPPLPLPTTTVITSTNSFQGQVSSFHPDILQQTGRLPWSNAQAVSTGPAQVVTSAMSGGSISKVNQNLSMNSVNAPSANQPSEIQGHQYSVGNTSMSTDATQSSRLSSAFSSSTVTSTLTTNPTVCTGAGGIHYSMASTTGVSHTTTNTQSHLSPVSKFDLPPKTQGLPSSGPGVAMSKPSVGGNTTGEQLSVVKRSALNTPSPPKRSLPLNGTSAVDSQQALVAPKAAPVGVSETRTSVKQEKPISPGLKGNKRTSEGSDSVSAKKRTKFEFGNTKYYETNPLLGMKRSCEAIEVYPDPPADTECNCDGKDDYSSSNEDGTELQMTEDGGLNHRETRQCNEVNKYTSDVSLPSSDRYKTSKEIYNGGANESCNDLDVSHIMPGVVLPTKPTQPFPAAPFRADLFGDLPLPHTRPHFDIGDVVWAQARGLPSWPGQIVDESKVGKGRADEGKKWVMWFGDHTFSQVEIDRLKTLSDGLRTLDEKARKKKYRAKKARISLEQAINEALEELEMRDRLKAKQGMRSKSKKKRLR